MQRILAIETSCDETAAAVIGDGRHVLSNVVASQESLHAAFGGVFPELASRQHILAIVPVIEEALAKASADWADLTAIAVTYGPGLAGSLLVGVNTAKALALARNVPLLGVNHLEGHIYANWLRVAPNADKDDPQFPFVALIVSGGHTDLVLMTEHCRYTSLGSTLDDAAGEAFDKTAKLLGLGYPGGPQVEALAKTGDSRRFDLPRPLKGRPGCDFSFSGLKTSVREIVQAQGAMTDQLRADICASFELAVSETLADRTRRAMTMFREACPETETPAFVVAGGVAANARLRSTFTMVASSQGFTLMVPPFHLCTDNAAMIAWAGAERFALGLSDGLDAAARARWPLDTASAPMVGRGRLGAKA